MATAALQCSIRGASAEDEKFRTDFLLMTASFRLTILLTGLVIFGSQQLITADELLPKPEKEQLVLAVKDLHDLFQEEYEQAERDDKAKQVLASTLLEAAVEENDPVMRYALLKEAIGLQADAKLAQNLSETTDAMAEAFAIDSIKIKSHFLKKIALSTKKKSDQANVVEAIQSVIDQAIATDRYDKALELITTGVALGEQTRDRRLAKRFSDLAKIIQEEHTEFRAVDQAQQTLEDKPLDAEANQTVGRWYCLKKGRWDEGVTYLALGNHPEMQALGRLDLKIDKSPTEMVRLGDLCWDLAGDMPNDLAALKNRAIYWYENSQPQVSGIVGKKISHRIEEWNLENEPLEEQKEDKKDATERQPKLAKSPKTLTKVKPKKSVAPSNLQGVPLWNRNGRVLAGTIPVQIPGKNNLYLHPFPEPGQSLLIYDLGGRYRSFTGAVGVPEVSGYRRPPRSEIRFSVLRDGKATTITTTGRRGARSVERFALDVTGVKQLVLVTSCRGNPEGCFAFWFNPVISPEEVAEKSKGPKRPN